MDTFKAPDPIVPPGAKLVDENPNYAVSPEGRVWRVTPTTWRGRWSKSPVPREIAPLYMGGEKRSKHVRLSYKDSAVSVARLVLEAFGPPRPTPYAKARFIDGDQTNARLENLQWEVRRSNP